MNIQQQSVHPELTHTLRGVFECSVIGLVIRLRRRRLIGRGVRPIGIDILSLEPGDNHKRLGIQSIAECTANLFRKFSRVAVSFRGELRHVDAPPDRYSRDRLAAAVRCRENNRQHPSPDRQQPHWSLLLLRREGPMEKNSDRYQTELRQGARSKIAHVIVSPIRRQPNRSFHRIGSKINVDSTYGKSSFAIAKRPCCWFMRRSARLPRSLSYPHSKSSLTMMSVSSYLFCGRF